MVNWLVKEVSKCEVCNVFR
jgi:hypothetical protein